MKVKYQIHDAIKTNLPNRTSYEDLGETITAGIEYKLKRGSNEIQGISFGKNGITFRGSEIDRKFSHAQLSKMFFSDRNPEEFMKYGKYEMR